MNRYIIGIKIETALFPKFADIGPMVSEQMENGTARIVSAEVIEQCEKCSKDLTQEESEEGLICVDCKKITWK